MTTPEFEAGLSSYPPALLVGSASPNRMRVRLPAGGDASPVPAGQAQTGEGDASQAAAGSLSPDATVLLVTAGAPGTYAPAVSAAERPRNVTELQQRAQPNGRAPWDAGQYVPVGRSGKRAHWTGLTWAGGESPGYVPAVAEDLHDASPAADVDASPAPVDTQFPGDGGDSSEDLHR